MVQAAALVQTTSPLLRLAAHILIIIGPSLQPQCQKRYKVKVTICINSLISVTTHQLPTKTTLEDILPLNKMQLQMVAIDTIHR